ncbi:MAG: DUF3078 domain-containing protein, partial [Alistipes sp.]|nr:DUF3078 domain-containing protein [Alistipes sp.]
VIRQKEWNERNNIDFKVGLTGKTTQHNKSWTTNNQNSISGELAAYYYHIYSKNKYSSTFRFDGIYGVNFIDEAWFKNQDKLTLYYLISWKVRDRGALRNWAYSFAGTFTSQFAEGYKSRTEKILLSNFMAPGRVKLDGGFTYKSPNRKLPFVLTVNPIAGETLFVLDDVIDDEQRKKLGLTAARRADGSLVRHKMEGGSSVRVDFNRTFALGRRGSTLQYNTTLSSFYGWMTQASRNNVAKSGEAQPERIMPTGEWTNIVSFNPLRFIMLEFRTTARYDKSQIDRIQMQYYLSAGLTYRFKNR